MSATANPLVSMSIYHISRHLRCICRATFLSHRLNPLSSPPASLLLLLNPCLCHLVVVFPHFIYIWGHRWQFPFYCGHKIPMIAKFTLFIFFCYLSLLSCLLLLVLFLFFSSVFAPLPPLLLLLLSSPACRLCPPSHSIRSSPSCLLVLVPSQFLCAPGSDMLSSHHTLLFPPHIPLSF